MGIVDDLLANTGLYLGTDWDPNDQHGPPAAARIEVKALPGGGGVTIDYETLNPALPERLRPHQEHTVIARTHDGGSVLVVAHSHANSLAIMQEGAPGVFELGDGGSPFPMRLAISVPAPGKLRYVWSYGAPGEVAVERDIAELTLVT